MPKTETSIPFNSALEVGLRALAMLVALHPRSVDLQAMVELDYLMIHSGDAGGPESLHPPLPMRSGELLVRRGVLERGVLLMMSRGLVARACIVTGFSYYATDAAQPLLESLRSPYLSSLRKRAGWVADTFGAMASRELAGVTHAFFQNWSAHFEVVEQVSYQ